MPTSVDTDRLSELEGSVLGLIWQSGPMTAYAVRTAFERSPTSFFSGSAGAIYPLVRRLQARGLLRSRAKRTDGRATRLLQITDAGIEMLESWIGPPLEAWTTSATLDPLRTRLLFSGVLPAARRRRLLAEAARHLEEDVAELTARRVAEGRDGPTELWIATTGALAVARARLRWVRWAAKELGHAPG